MSLPRKCCTDEGDTSTSVDKESGVAAVDNALGHQWSVGSTGGEREGMSNTDSLTSVVTTLAGLSAILLTVPAVGAICGGLLGLGGTRGGVYARYHGAKHRRRARGFGIVETLCYFKCFSNGGWLVDPKGEPDVPVCAPLNETVQNMSFPLLLGEYVPRQVHEGTEETIQGFTGLLLEESESVSDGGKRFIASENFFEGSHQGIIGGGWGGKAVLDLLGQGSGKPDASLFFWAIGQVGMGCPEPDF